MEIFELAAERVGWSKGCLAPLFEVQRDDFMYFYAIGLCEGWGLLKGVKTARGLSRRINRIRGAIENQVAHSEKKE